jgi:hypothetical protein
MTIETRTQLPKRLPHDGDMKTIARHATEERAELLAVVFQRARGKRIRISIALAQQHSMAQHRF